MAGAGDNYDAVDMEESDEGGSDNELFACKSEYKAFKEHFSQPKGPINRGPVHGGPIEDEYGGRGSEEYGGGGAMPGLPVRDPGFGGLPGHPSQGFPVPPPGFGGHPAPGHPDRRQDERSKVGDGGQHRDNRGADRDRKDGERRRSKSREERRRSRDRDERRRSHSRDRKRSRSRDRGGRGRRDGGDDRHGGGRDRGGRDHGGRGWDRDRDRRGGYEERRRNREERERENEEQMRKAEEMGVEIPKYFKPGGIQPVSYAEQVLKRKMLWSKPTASAVPEQKLAAGVVEPRVLNPKDNSGPTSWNKWETTNFGDGEKNEKFRRLMGIKASAPPEAVKSSRGGVSGVLNPDQQQKIESDLESNYEVARQQTHRNRGLGLGFSNAEPFQPLPHASHDPLAMAGFVRKNS